MALKARRSITWGSTQIAAANAALDFPHRRCLHDPALSRKVAAGSDIDAHNRTLRLMQCVLFSIVGQILHPGEVRRVLLKLLMIGAALTLSACAGLPGREPLQVNVADVESLPSEGLEARMLVKLRVQNPNDSPVEYSGVYVKLDVQDKTFATGVSDERGTIPRFGESIISVPVTVSMLRAAINALRILGGAPFYKIHYKLEGKLDAPMFGSLRFQTQGEFSVFDLIPQ
jgi:LEA14-like dessication related protein